MSRAKIPMSKSQTSPAATAEAAPVAIPGKPPLWAWTVSTFCGVGTLHPGPGTWGSLSAVLLWSAGARFAPLAWQTPLCILLAAAAVTIGIPAATSFARATGRKDPQQVVIDEVAGQLIAVIGSPIAWKPLLVGFILFRLFDMTKPAPIRRLELLPEGTGIVVDDVGAGIYALILMQLMLHFRILG
jgi:phosphatidylglycerophosphatase A